MKMPQELVDAIVNDLQGAVAMIGQAQERTLNSSELWHELGKLYDIVDDLQSSVQGHEYDDNCNFEA